MGLENYGVYPIAEDGWNIDGTECPKCHSKAFTKGVSRGRKGRKSFLKCDICGEEISLPGTNNRIAKLEAKYG